MSPLNLNLNIFHLASLTLLFVFSVFSFLCCILASSSNFLRIFVLTHSHAFLHVYLSIFIHIIYAIMFAILCIFLFHFFLFFTRYLSQRQKRLAQPREKAKKRPLLRSRGIAQLGWQLIMKSHQARPEKQVILFYHNLLLSVSVFVFSIYSPSHMPIFIY